MIDRDNYKPNDPEQLVEKAINYTIERVNRTYGLSWESRQNLCKTVLTLTVAILVGTISFSGSLAGPGKAELNHVWILMVTWITLALSIIAALYSLWNVYRLNDLPIILGGKKEKMENAIRDVVGADALVDSLADLLISDNTGKEIQQFHGRSHSALETQLILFGFGIVIFLIFGILQVIK